MEFNEIQHSYYFYINGTNNEIFTGDIISYLNKTLKVSSTTRDLSKSNDFISIIAEILM